MCRVTNFFFSRLHALRLAGYRQSVRLGAKRLVAHDQSLFFFCNLTIAVIVLVKHILRQEDGFDFYEYAWPSVKCMYRTYSIVLKILPFTIYTSPLSVRLCKADHTYLIHLTLQWQLVT
jgi:hypothetical protein